MKGKIVIDVGNPRVDRDGEVGKDGLARGTGVTSKEHLPGVRLVRALNALSFTQVTKEAHRAGEKLGIPIASDDKEAIAVTVQLVEDAGFDPVVVGGLGPGPRVRRRHAGLREGPDRGAAQGGAEAAVDACAGGAVRDRRAATCPTAA